MFILVYFNRNFKGIRSRPSLDSTGSREMDEDEGDDEEKMDSAPGAQHWVYGMKEGTLLNAKVSGENFIAKTSIKNACLFM